MPQLGWLELIKKEVADIKLLRLKDRNDLGGLSKWFSQSIDIDPKKGGGYKNMADHLLRVTKTKIP